MQPLPAADERKEVHVKDMPRQRLVGVMSHNGWPNGTGDRVSLIKSMADSGAETRVNSSSWRTDAVAFLFSMDFN